MSNLPLPITPERWMTHLFSARAAAEGGVVRRKVTDLERLVGRQRFLYEVRRRGYHLIENSGQFIVICNAEPVEVLL